MAGSAMRGHRSSSWFGIGLVVVVAWGAISFGAVYPWAYWPLTGAGLILGLAGAVRGKAWDDPRTRALGLALAATAVAIGLQLVALPYSLLSRMSPGLDRFLRQFTVAYHPASLHSISIGPESTAVALALFVSLAVLLIGTIRSMRQVGLEWLVGQLMGLGAALALFGVVQQAFLDTQAPLVYGFWQPQPGSAPYGPFINKNHFAGWMVMVLPMVAGYAYALFLQSPRPQERGLASWLRWVLTVDASRFVLVSAVCLAMSLTVVLTGSRSGIVCLSLALGVLGTRMWRSLAVSRRRMMVLVYLGLIVVGAIAWGGVDTLAARFATAPSHAEGRLSAWRDAGSIIEDFPWFGTGLGTYGQAMLVYQTSDRASMYVQAHNDYVQLLAEGGALVTIPAIVVGVFLVSGIRRRMRSGQDDLLTRWVRTGAVAGLIGIAAQSLVEFSLQMPGNTVLFVVLLAVALHRPTVPVLAHARRI
jgi:hypothetical protein